MLIRRIFQYCLVSGGLLFSACTTPDIQMVRPLADASGPSTVAVLPFSLEVELDAGERPQSIFRKVFYSYFSYLGYRDLKLEEVDRRLRKAGYRSVQAIHKIPRAELKRILGVDAVIYGRVVDASNFTAGVYAETRLKAELEFWELTGDKPLWVLDHHEIELSGIAQSTIVNMVQDQIINSETDLAYYRSAEVFAVKAMKKIPDPARLHKKHVHPPVIKSMQANLRPGQLLKEGDMIEVLLVGPKGLKASFDIGSDLTYQAMQEIAPGVYQGSYSIKKEDRFERALIIGRLQDHEGLIGKKILNTLVSKVNV